MQLRDFLRQERGATAMEFAFVAPLVITLVIATIEVGALEVMSSNLDAAVMSTTRTIRTGAADRPTSSTSFVDAVCAKMVDDPATCRSRIATSVKTYSSFASAMADTAPPTGQFNAGGPQDVVVIKVTYQWPLILPMYAGSFQLAGPTQALLDASAAFRNEPYE
jgi:Flp pilus assembly protein TadG